MYREPFYIQESINFNLKLLDIIEKTEAPQHWVANVIAILKLNRRKYYV